ncbi:MAG: MgtC/SapB family protein [Ruminococcaceae bacterium]|nr:MgtC/SapB family protein [Oscillospiraceae bacterium]
MDWRFILECAIKAILAVIIGGIIGSERARHGRAAGMRTHILVCLGATLTAMTGMFLSKEMGGDAMRISAQVVSGIGFLGAGMIIIKNDNVVSGLTTAAGIWATSIVGIAIGYGFYVGAVMVSVLMLLSIILLARLERGKRRTEAIYIEIDDMGKTNEVIDKIVALIGKPCPHKVYSAKSGNTNNVGVIILLDRTMNFDFNKILEIEHVLYVDED